MHRVLHLNRRWLVMIASVALTVPATALANFGRYITKPHHPTGHAACIVKDRHSCKSAHHRAVHSEPISKNASRIHGHHSHLQPGNPPTSTPSGPSTPTLAETPTSPSETPSTPTITPAPTSPPASPPSTTSPPSNEAPTSTGEAPAPIVEAPVLTITGTTYYVSASGSDSHSGTSPSSAWRTVKRVNEASLAPGDGVLFQGGSTFSDETLMPATSGAAGSLIIFGSYGTGNVALPKGAWFRGKDHLAFEHLTINAEGGFQGTGNDITVEWCSISNDSLAINATGSNSDWTIDDNTINHTGDSGMLLEGEKFTISGNTITNTGLDPSIPYGKHGIYLKVSNATVTDNTITNFSSDGISVRYRNSVLTGNHISEGAIGIAWFQYDPIAGASHWTGNAITDTTDAGIHVSPSDIGGNTRESFVIERNTVKPAAGVYMNLQPTAGTYTVQENTLR
jgi:Right handed beta helix region